MQDLTPVSVTSQQDLTPVSPLFLGGGKRLFDQLGKEIELERMRVVDSPGVTHLKYRVVK